MLKKLYATLLVLYQFWFVLTYFRCGFHPGHSKIEQQKAYDWGVFFHVNFCLEIAGFILLTLIYKCFPNWHVKIYLWTAFVFNLFLAVIFLNYFIPYGYLLVDQIGFPKIKLLTYYFMIVGLIYVVMNLKSGNFKKKS